MLTQFIRYSQSPKISHLDSVCVQKIEQQNRTDNQRSTEVGLDREKSPGAAWSIDPEKDSWRSDRKDAGHHWRHGSRTPKD